MRRFLMISARVLYLALVVCYVILTPLARLAGRLAARLAMRGAARLERGLLALAPAPVNRTTLRRVV